MVSKEILRHIVIQEKSQIEKDGDFVERMTLGRRPFCLFFPDVRHTFREFFPDYISYFVGRWVDQSANRSILPAPVIPYKNFI